MCLTVAESAPHMHQHSEFNSEFRKKMKLLSKHLSQFNAIQSSEKKQDPLKNSSFYNEIPKKKFLAFFKISPNMIERCTNKKKIKNKKYRNLKIFSSDII